ncbi:MAG: hypothetical protein GJ676_19680 [Rhodobacteraceae bacterium]|nr:hypothetical protein [Paracoccaceae bacterium]
MRSFQLLSIISALVLLPSGLLAQQFKSSVQSGEHDGFTRLVLRLPTTNNWSIENAGRTVRIDVGNPDVIFDTSVVFDKIDRTRLLEVTQVSGRGQLELELACSCEITSFEQDQRYLVVDINDPETDTRNPLSMTFPTYGFNYRFPWAQPNQPETDFELPASEPEALPPSPSELHVPLQAKLQSLSLPFNPEDREKDGSVSVAEQRLLQQIGHASDQGLIDLKPDLDQDELASQVQDSADPTNIRVETVVDRDFNEFLTEARSEIPTQQACSEGNLIDLHNWGGSESFTDQIAKHRQHLFAEFDVLDLRQTEDLVDVYLYFGFGAEARQLMMLLPNTTEGYREKLSLAAILDDTRNLHEAFTGQQNCDGDASLWAVMESGTLDRSANKNAIQRSFSALPMHLRVQLGPRLSSIFVAANDSEGSKAILRMVDRSGAEHIPRRHLAEADLAQVEGHGEKQVQHLEAAVVENDEHSPEAIVRIVRTSIEERRALAPQIPDLVGAYAFEHRDTELGGELRQAEILALGLTGDFTRAFEYLSDLRQKDGRAAANAIHSSLLQLLTEQSDDLTFLGLVLKDTRDIGSHVELKTSVLVAQRLLDLGFPGQARDMLERLDTGERRREDVALLLAQSALELNLPHRAMIDLLGVQSKDADLLRAQAMLINGDVAQAASLQAASGDPQAARSYWHARQEPEDNAVADQTPFGGVLEVTSRLREDSGPLENLPPLAQAQALIDSSVLTRATLDDLFESLDATSR